MDDKPKQLALVDIRSIPLAALMNLRARGQLDAEEEEELDEEFWGRCVRGGHEDSCSLAQWVEGGGDWWLGVCDCDWEK